VTTEPKYPPDAYRGFRASLPDWFIDVGLSSELQRAIKRLELKPGDCVLDAACGSGFNIKRLVRVVGPDGLVFAVEDNPNLLTKAKEKVTRGGWPNVRLLDELDPDQLQRTRIDGIVVSFNPPILLQRPDLLEAAWRLLKPGGRIAMAAARNTTFGGRLLGAPFVRLSLWLLGHPGDYHYWTVHEPWKHLAELSTGRLWVERRVFGLQYVLWAEKPRQA